MKNIIFVLEYDILFLEVLSVKKLFGTDGVRGVANTELSPELAFKLGRAGAYVLTKDAKSTAKVLVAKDGRRSGDMLEAALAAGLCSIGAQVYQCGVMPTPAVAYLVQKYNFDAGVMITASHNPVEDNGIKFFNSQGFKLPDRLEEEIEELIAAIESNDTLTRPTGADVGVVKSCPNALDDYAAFVASTVPGLNLGGMKLAIDCANGATSEVAHVIFEKLGASVHTLFNQPDGSNINANCGSTHMSNLKEFVTANKMDLGLAFDGDGDRMLAVDQNGNEVDGDLLLAICGLDLQQRGQLAGSTIVATVMSNQGLEVFCKSHGITLLRAAVGDRYVLEKMLEGNFVLGGEQSGHTILRRFSTTGDGILAGIHLLAALARQGKSLAQMSQMVEIFPQVLINVRVNKERMKDLYTCPKIKKVKDEIEAQFTGDDRILLRTSGTEPLVRVLFEGRDAGKINAWAKQLADAVKESLSE